MTTDEKTIIDSLTEVAGEVAKSDFVERLHFIGAECKSPIERILLGALMLQFTDPTIRIFKNVKGQPLPVSSLLIGNDHWDSEYIGGIYPQMPIGQYIADFYFEVFDKESQQRWFQMIIECDGHDFHEKTKEQSKRDKKRDRWFQSRGIIVLRFTGSEVWRDPHQCAEEIEDAFFAAYRRRKGRE